MPIRNTINTDDLRLLKLNEDIQKDSPRFDYHMEHIKLVRKYALLINRRLNYNLDNAKLSYAALSHDILKEHGLDKNKVSCYPQDLNKYVRENLVILKYYNLDDYFNTSIQYHALAAGIYLIKELHIKDPEILYPVMFHSCPIIDVYEDLPIRIRTSVDIIMMADKLSSNYLRINSFSKPVRIDLDQAVFGSSGREFNYTLGLFLARLISQGKSDEIESVTATEYYYKRLSEANPLISKIPNIKKLGENKLWEKRKSQALMIH